MDNSNKGLYFTLADGRTIKATWTVECKDHRKCAYILTLLQFRLHTCAHTPTRLCTGARSDRDLQFDLEEHHRESR